MENQEIVVTYRVADPNSAVGDFYTETFEAAAVVFDPTSVAYNFVDEGYDVVATIPAGNVLSIVKSEY